MRYLILFSGAFFAVLCIVYPAFAQTTGTVADVLCLIVKCWIPSTLGKAIATLGVISLGLAAALGKISPQLTMIIAVGIAITFGAAPLVSQLGWSGSPCVSANC